MKECFDEHIIRANLRNAISAYCNMQVRKGECGDDDCLCCSVNNVYDLARENENRFVECDDGVRRLYGSQSCENTER